MADLLATNSRRKPNKRPYRKSTMGCTSCKARKVKCDEARPICSPCRKRFVVVDDCIYEHANTPPMGTVPSCVALTSPLQSTIAVHPVGNNGSNILELRLLYHYTQNTCLQSSPVTSVPVNRVWEFDIPMIAFSSELALNALFAISALDLSSRNPDDQTMAYASKSYFGKAVAQHRMALAKIDSQNAIPIIIAAVLITHHTWLSAHCRPKEVPYSAERDTFNMCEGIVALTDMVPVLEKYKHPIVMPKPISVCGVRNVRFLTSALDDVRNFWENVDVDETTASDVEVYERTSRELVDLYRLVAEGFTTNMKLEQASITFLHTVPRRFVELLDNHEPIAMALWIRSVAILNLLGTSGSWWLQGSGNCKVSHRAVNGIKDLMPSEMAWTMEWPLKVISGEVTLDTFDRTPYIS